MLVVLTTARNSPTISGSPSLEPAGHSCSKSQELLPSSPGSPPPHWPRQIPLLEHLSTGVAPNAKSALCCAAITEYEAFRDESLGVKCDYDPIVGTHYPRGKVALQSGYLSHPMNAPLDPTFNRILPMPHSGQGMSSSSTIASSIGLAIFTVSLQRG